MANFNPTLSIYLTEILSSPVELSEQREEDLKRISQYISGKLLEKKKISMVFICTHNSRRSHMGQVWAQVWAEYFGISAVSTYSGGTEATAFHLNAVAAMGKSGLEFSSDGPAVNPHFQVSWNEEGPQVSGIFSKKFSHEVNPQKDFIAIMVCADADEACPFVPGAESRVAIPYDDPKAFDGTSEEADKYEERSIQIARELAWMYQQVRRS
ncbi:MAG: protein-tyrosine-phosphatase [Bacteroidota bacterium]